MQRQIVKTVVRFLFIAMLCVGQVHMGTDSRLWMERSAAPFRIQAACRFPRRR